MVVEQNVSVSLRVVLRLSLGTVSGGRCGLVCPISQDPRASAPLGHFHKFSRPEDKSS